jgi:hypothetical protein
MKLMMVGKTNLLNIEAIRRHHHLCKDSRAVKRNGADPIYAQENEMLYSNPQMIENTRRLN